jgi:hypothetical protein
MSGPGLPECQICTSIAKGNHAVRRRLEREGRARTAGTRRRCAFPTDLDALSSSKPMPRTWKLWIPLPPPDVFPWRQAVGGPSSGRERFAQRPTTRA